ncbi:hypothetical protein HCJ66_00370 [Listeria sp. FSL L7-1582]|uniref:hypothetical protein n=1 Tax=Listeria portnoyi TaxID=2713504 RepID=UPI00164E3691|nr:hypothetical protein [Listeria portnoyi]MBC6307993.1 hypothetical protein [Listeria portnoyi]
MKIPKSDLQRFSHLIEIICEDGDNEIKLQENLRKLTIEDLERLKSYLSGTRSLTPYNAFFPILSNSFLGGLAVYLVFMYQTNPLILLIAPCIVLAMLLEIFLVIVKVPLPSHSILTHRRRKYDRIVQVIEVILKKRYLKELQNAVIDF